MEDDDDNEPEELEVHSQALAKESENAQGAEASKESQMSEAEASMRRLFLDQKSRIIDGDDVEMIEAPSKKRGRKLQLREADARVAQQIAENVALEREEMERNKEEKRRSEHEQHATEFGEDERNIHHVVIVQTCPLVKADATKASRLRNTREEYSGPNFKRFRKVGFDTACR